MTTVIHKHREMLQESLRFCLYPRSMVERFGSYGLELTLKLLDSGTFLHLFAAVDIVCSFYSATTHATPLLPTLKVNPQCDSHFANLYRNYPRYILSLFDHACLRMFKAEASRFTCYQRSREEGNESSLFRTFLFIIAEFALECPFITLTPSFPPSILRKINWHSMLIPQRLPFEPQEEEALLVSLGLNLPLSTHHNREDDKLSSREVNGMDASSSVLAATGDTDPRRVEVLLGTISQWYRERTDLQRSPPGVPRYGSAIEKTESIEFDIARLPHNLDYKLIDSYLDNFDQFELDDDLRHKITLLKQISLLSAARSPFITEYSRQWTSGTPNPAFLIQGWKKFLLKMIEGGPVYLGKPNPLFDQDKVAIRFSFIEELRTACEKPLDAKDRPRFSHLNIHKLAALLVAHDMVKYLGAISRMGMTLEFVIFNSSSERGSRSSGALHTNTFRHKVVLNDGFMVKNRSVQGFMLTETSPTSLQAGTFDKNFFKEFFSYHESLTSITPRNGRGYDFYFGPGGAFLQKNGGPPAAFAEHSLRPLRQEKFSPNPCYKEILTEKFVRSRSNHLRRFICETNSRYVLAMDSGGENFKSSVVDYNLGAFLNSFRWFVLNLVTDEAIQFRLAHS